MKPAFNLVTIECHLSKRMRRANREAKCLYVPPMGQFILFYKQERVICLN